MPIHWEVFATREEAVTREKELKTGFGRKWLKREYEKDRLKASARQAGAWIAEGKTLIGYEISFNKYFYVHQPLRDLNEVVQEIRDLENETEGLLEKILNF